MRNLKLTSSPRKCGILIGIFLFCLPILSFAQEIKIGDLFDPIPTPTTHHTLYVYELRIKNTSNHPIQLARIEVKANENSNKTLATYVGHTLLDNVLLIDNDKKIPVTDKVVLNPNNTVYTYIYLKLPKTAAPLKKIHNTLWLLSLSDGTAFVKTDIIQHTVNINNIKPLVIGYPMQGGNWVAMGGLSPTSYHRRSILGGPFNFHLAQRYAIDWVEICKGRLVHGNMNENKNWFSFGHPIIAVADGVVVKVHEGLSLNTPPSFPGKLNNSDIAGNHIIEKVTQNGKDYYVLYAHMQPGSIKVKEGMKLKQGQFIGLLGNTGNSSLPHLHLHVSNNDSPLKGEGIPFVFEHATVLGQAETIFEDYGLYKEKFNVKSAGNYKDITPTENQVIQFPGKHRPGC